MIPLDWFTPGEREVWELKQAGKSWSEIAEELAQSKENVWTLYRSAKRRWNNGGPRAAGKHSTRVKAARERVLSSEQCPRCLCRGGHVCLFASGWDRRPTQWE